MARLGLLGLLGNKVWLGSVRFGRFPALSTTTTLYLSIICTLSLNRSSIPQVVVPIHSIAFGPIVDDIIVPSQAKEETMVKQFQNYDVIIGMTQSESLLMFPASIGMYS
jgi:hypothetical protein